MPIKNRKYFQDNNAHPHDAAGMARLLELLSESTLNLHADETDTVNGEPDFAGGFLESDTNRETLTGDMDLGARTDPAKIQNLDPGGAARVVTLPAESDGLRFVIGNRADAAEDITVNDDSGTTIATVNQDDVGVFRSDGTGWIGFAAAGGVT